MDPQRTERLDADNPADIARAAKILRSGGVVAFPTETVYGLGASAFNAEAIEKIFRAKQRPHWDPLIVHIADVSMLGHVVRAADPVSRSLIARFWPGPLTLLLPRSERIPDSVTAARPLVGVRQPAHDVAIELIRQAGVPLAAPSANIFGHTSPTTAAHVLADLDGRIDAVLDGGPCEVGLESTVAEVVPDGIVVYRPGALDLSELESLSDVGRVRLYDPFAQAALMESLPAPGVGLRHYAPRARLVLVPADPSDPEHSLLAALGQALESSESVGAMLPDGWAILPGCRSFSWGSWRDPETLARRLYEGLRTLDSAGATIILCPVPEAPGLSHAIRDRLQKAATP